MGDRLIVHDLTVPCRLGVFEWEQERPQPVWVDLELGIAAARAGRSDDVAETVDYVRVLSAIRQLAERRRFRLLETLAEAIAARVLEECDTPWVSVCVKKRALPGLDYAAVAIERTRRGALRRRSAAKRSPERPRRLRLAKPSVRAESRE